MTFLTVVLECNCPWDQTEPKAEVELCLALQHMEGIVVVAERGVPRSRIRAGIGTPTTRKMLEGAERLVADRKAALRALPTGRPILPPIEETVGSYLNDLRGTLTTDITAAPELLTRGIQTITVRPVGGQLVAEMRGSLVGLLEFETICPNDGAGSPSPALYSWPLATAAVA